MAEAQRVELLYFDGCPSHGAAEALLREALDAEELEAEVELVAVNTDEEARTLRFPGSPTIRLNGEDLFPVPEQEDWRLGCRVYATPEGFKGSPTIPMLRKTLRGRPGAAGGGPAEGEPPTVG